MDDCQQCHDTLPFCSPAPRVRRLPPVASMDKDFSGPSISSVRAAPAPQHLHLYAMQTTSPSRKGWDEEGGQGALGRQERVLVQLCPRDERAAEAFGSKNAVLRSMSVSGAANMLCRGHTVSGTPLFPGTRVNSSTVVGGVFSAIAACIGSAGRAPYWSTYIPTNSRLVQHHLDGAKFTEIPPACRKNRTSGTRAR